jgi:hypothetical protein
MIGVMIVGIGCGTPRFVIPLNFSEAVKERLTRFRDTEETEGSSRASSSISLTSLAQQSVRLCSGS